MRGLRTSHRSASARAREQELHPEGAMQGGSSAIHKPARATWAEGSLGTRSREQTFPRGQPAPSASGGRGASCLGGGWPPRVLLALRLSVRCLDPQRLAGSPGSGATRWRSLCPRYCPGELPGEAVPRESGGAEAGGGPIHMCVSFRAVEPRLWQRAPKLRAPFRRSLTLGTEQPLPGASSVRCR